MEVKTEFPHAIREIENIWIPLSDGTRLAARIWLPVDAETNPVPALLEYLPYRKSDGTASRDAIRHPYLAGHGYDVTAVHPGDTLELGPFRLEFFGGRHAVIHESIPVVDNLGVMVNDDFYYPGDSYAVPEGREVKLLASPVGAPWLKIGEAMDFVLAVAPQQAFGTHDMTLSVLGRDMHRARLRWAVEQHGGEFLLLEPGDSTDL